MTTDGYWPISVLEWCRLCGELMNPEHPFAVWGLNPETFRRGWMHGLCFMDAYADLVDVPPKDPVNFDSRLDEYQQLVA